MRQNRLIMLPYLSVYNTPDYRAMLFHLQGDEKKVLKDPRFSPAKETCGEMVL